MQVSEIKQCSLKQEAHASLTHGSDGGGGGAAGRVPGSSLTNTGVPLARGLAAFTKASDLLKSDINSVENVCKTNTQTVIDLSDDLDQDGGLSMQCSEMPHFEGISPEAESIDLTGFISLQVDNELGTSQPPTVNAVTYPLTPTAVSVSGPAEVMPTTMSVHQVDGGSRTDSITSTSREAGGFVSAGTLLKGKSKMAPSRAAKDARGATKGLTTASHREPGKM